MVQTHLVKCICVVGPTASGKSALAFDLAHKLGGEIINADSRQFYKELTIGTAKPTLAEQSQIKHHLIDCASIKEPWHVARFVDAASQAIQDCEKRKVVPIVVGGTGLYLRSLIWGMDDIPKIDPKIRKEILEEYNHLGIEAVYKQLKAVDPDSAQRLKSNDTQRILRALEVWRQTQKSIHEFWSDKAKPKFKAFRVALDLNREELYHKINRRVLVMMDQGLKAEVLRLQKQHTNNSVLLKTIGYREWFENEADTDEVIVAKIQKNTRRFAKRQLTWFRKEEDITWLAPKEVSQVFEKAKLFLKEV